MSRKQPVLILESDPVQQALIEHALADYPYALTMAGSADAAVAAFEKLQHPVALLDIHPQGESSGISVLKKLMESSRSPVSVMLAGEKDLANVIESKRAGAFDFITKPIDAADLRGIVDKAMQAAHTAELARSADEERRRKMEAQLATKHVAERLLRRENDKFAKALFGNIHTSFSQGRGVGVMTTLVSMLAGTPLSADGQHYLVGKDVLDMIMDNQAAVSDMIQTFSELQTLVSQDMVLFDMSLGEFHGIVRDLIFEMQPVAQLRGHRVLLSDLPARFTGTPLRINWEYFRKALRELLLNAMKFSPENSAITVLVEYLFSRVLITVLNQPAQMSRDEPKGIPEEFRKVIFEPFFRLSKVVHEQYKTLEYGLGLTLVEKVIHMHQGQIRCTTIKDHFLSAEEDDELIAFEIELPS
jgi:signal transduction histidine kinase